ncbi:MAG: hypothetical protein PWQ60_442 [Thermoanaerobacteraceae bacterium]|nr:hypothetical protein [Thermoanaerobacteraceae bacterium]
MNKKLIALLTLLLLLFASLILPLNSIYAAGEFPFTIGGITVDCIGQRTINENDKPQVLLNKNGGLDKLTLCEQSTYQDKLPNHYYYRTVKYIMALLSEPNVESIIMANSYDNNPVRKAENERMRQLISERSDYEFGEPYVTSYTFSRKFFDDLFIEGAIDDANWLLKVGQIELYKSDSNGEEGPTIGSMFVINENEDQKTIKLLLRDIVTKGLLVDSAFRNYIDDFVTRTEYVNLKTGEELPVWQFKQVDIVEDEEGNTVDVNIRDAELKDNKIVIKPYEGATMKEWVLVKNPPEPISNNITWKDASNLPGKVQEGGPNETPEIMYLASHTVFVRYTLGDNAGGQQGDQTGSEQDIKGDLVLSEKRITKVFDLSKFGLPTFTFSYDSAGRHRHTDDEGDAYYVERSKPVDDKYKYVIGISEELNKLAVATSGDKFSPRFNGTNIKEGIANWNGGKDRVTPNLYFMVWRGKDLPTLADYKEPEKHPLLALGLKRGHIPQTTRNNQGGYTENLKIKLGQSAGGDYSTTFACLECGDTRTQTHITNDKAVYDLTVGVKSFIGSPNTGNKTSDYKTETFTAGGITFKNVKGFAIPHDIMIKFYPYIQMAYDMFDNAGDEASYKTYAVNVLAQHLSAMKVNDYIEVGWYNPNPSMSLTINSNQWSTYVRAVEAFGKNSVLPGGALYSLTTGNSPTKVGIRTWQVYVPDDLRQYLVEGQEFSYDRASKADNDFAAQVKNTLDTLDVVQYVSNNPKADNAFGGVEILAKGGQSIYGNTTSSYDKYWLRRGTPQNSNYANEADLDVLDEDKTVTFYRVRADVNGNVYIEKSTNGSSWTTLDKLSKTEGVGALTNAEAKGLDARTKIITNFVLALDRNKGNDSTVSNGPGWYNEAWDGIYVMRVDRVYTVGFGSPKVRSVALDVKLTPPLDSAAGIFTRYYLSQFKVNEKSYLRADKPNGYLGNFNGKDVILPNMDLMYVSRKFWIPNCTVMDLKQ